MRATKFVWLKRNRLRNEEQAKNCCNAQTNSAQWSDYLCAAMIFPPRCRIASGIRAKDTLTLFGAIFKAAATAILFKEKWFRTSYWTKAVKLASCFSWDLDCALACIWLSLSELSITLNAKTGSMQRPEVELFFHLPERNWIRRRLHLSSSCPCHSVLLTFCFLRSQACDERFLKSDPVVKIGPSQLHGHQLVFSGFLIKV